MWKYFKEFSFEVNLLNWAIAYVIEAAFGKILSSLVYHIIMPLVGILLNGVTFENLVYEINGVDIMYGSFIQSILDFFIIAISIFLFVRLLMKFKREEEEEEIGRAHV